MSDLPEGAPRQWLRAREVDAWLARRRRARTDQDRTAVAPAPATRDQSAPADPRGRRWSPLTRAKAAGAALALLLVIWATSGFYKVEPDQVGMVLDFGRWVRTDPPGLNYHLPYPFETALLPKVTQVNQLNIGNGAVRPMLTGDENIVEATAVVFWRVKDPAKFLFNVTDPEAVVRLAAEGAVRQVIGLNPIQAALSDQRQKIADDARARLQALLDAYDMGVAVQQVQLQRVDPPAAVIDAFNDVQRARADQERSRNEAEAYSNDILPRARGEAERLKQEAQAYREQVTNTTTGDAARYLALYATYQQAPEITAQRMYLDTMEEVLKAAGKIVLDPSGHGLSGVVPYMALGERAHEAVPTQSIKGAP